MNQNKNTQLEHQQEQDQEHQHPVLRAEEAVSERSQALTFSDRQGIGQDSDGLPTSEGSRCGPASGTYGW